MKHKILLTGVLILFKQRHKQYKYTDASYNTCTTKKLNNVQTYSTRTNLGAPNLPNSLYKRFFFHFSTRKRLILGLDVFDEVDDSARVSVLVVVPGNQLDKVRVERNAGGGVKNRGVRVADEVAGDDVFFCVSQDTLEGAFCGGLYLGLDFVVCRGLAKSYLNLKNYL